MLLFDFFFFFFFQAEDGIRDKLVTGVQTCALPISNVLAFENLIDVAPYLFGLIMLTPDSSSLAQHGLSGALVSRAVTQRIGDPAKDEPLLFVGDPPATFVVDGLGLRPPLPKIDGMSITENYGAMVLHKLYTFSAGHATTAYLDRKSVV